MGDVSGKWAGAFAPDYLGMKFVNIEPFVFIKTQHIKRDHFSTNN